MDKLLTIQQLSEYLQVSPKTIYQWTHIGFIPYYKFPKGVRFREEEILNWMVKRRNKGRQTYKLTIT